MFTMTAKRPMPGASDRLEHDFRHCYGCGICGEVCPKGALTIAMDTERVQADHRKEPRFDSSKCVHCGRCAAVCSSGAIRHPEFDAWLTQASASGATHVVYYCTRLNQLAPERAIVPQPFPAVSAPLPTPVPGQGGAMSFSTPLSHQRFEPGAVLSNQRFVPDIFNVPAPEGLALVGLRCTGRIGGRRLLQMAMAGMRNVLVFACPPHDCEYGAGDTCLAELQIGGIKAMLEEYGVADLRLEILTANPGSPDKVQELVRRFHAGQRVGQ